jgi:hypothetical protein
VAFLEPLRQALRVLDAVANLSTRPKGGYSRGVRYSWVLNDGRGAKVGPAGTFTASMQFEIVECDPDSNEFGHPWRVSTREYIYRLRSPDGQDAWRMHWHPEGNSPITWAHLHLPPDFGRHLACDRMTLEQAILWCAEYGAPLTCSRQEAENRLLLIEAPHRLHRTWPR